jgi:hypothetical protein|tara:strand:- start:1039 stop:1353 length:315 start_codon:yes stop_codon:yes gene_type:complete
MSKITLTTVKSFIKNNKGKIFISTLNRFSGMTDGIEPCNDKGFYLADQTDPKQLEHGRDNTMGIKNAYFVFDSRDYFSIYEDDQFNGYEVSNCIGNFILAIKEK